MDAEDAEPAEPAQRSRRPSRPARPPAEVAAELAAQLGLPLVLRRRPRTRWAPVGALAFVALLVLAEGAWAWSIGDTLGPTVCAVVAAGLLAGATIAWRRLSIEATVREDGIAWRGPGIDVEARYRDLELDESVLGVLLVRAWGRWLPVPLEGAGPGAGKVRQFIRAQTEAARPQDEAGKPTRRKRRIR